MLLKKAERKRVKRKMFQGKLEPACIPISFLDLHNIFFINFIINACLHVHLRYIHSYKR